MPSRDNPFNILNPLSRIKFDFHRGLGLLYIIPTGPFLDLWDWDAKRLLPRVKALILFIYGDHENFADLEDTRKCFYAFTGEKKAYMLIGNASHGLVLEESHDMVYRAIYGWLSN